MNRFKDLCVLAVMITLCVLLYTFLDRIGFGDWKFSCGFIVGSLFYDWYKKKQ